MAIDDTDAGALAAMSLRAFGGWQSPLVDEVAGAQVGAAYEGTDALLLGRRTYDTFAAYWPHQEGCGH